VGTRRVAPIRAADEGTDPPEEFEFNDRDALRHPEDDGADKEEDEEE